MKTQITEQIPLVIPAKRTNSIQEYYFSQKLEQISRMRTMGIDVINLGIGSPDLPPAPDVIKTLQQSASEPEHHGYQSYRGTKALRKAFSDWYKRIYQVDLNPDNEIIPLMGSKEGIMHISLAFLDPGDEVLVPDPGYPTYAAATRLAGARPLLYPLKEENAWLPNLEYLEQKGMTRAKMMWVNYPNMPVGAVCNKEFFESLIAFARKHNILIINDNPYSLLLNDNPLSVLSVDGSKDIAIELNSLSKSHNMAGWRMGMAAANSEFANQILMVKSNMDSGMFKPLQDAAVTALNLDTDWYDRLNNIYKRRRYYVWKMCESLGCTFRKNQAGLFVWAKIPEGQIDAASLSDQLLDKCGLFITPGQVFGTNGNKYLRISLCANESVLEEALKRVNRFVSSSITQEFTYALIKKNNLL